MYKLIIADDEKIIRQGLATIRWADHGISVAAISSNGLECMEQMRLHHPDIVLTDIRMPGLSGIDIARQARAEGFPAKFIILTGFRDFEYAQQSIELEVISFVLKPSSPTELLAAVEKAVERIGQERKAGKELEDLHKQVREANLALWEKLMPEGGPTENKLISQLLEYLESNYKEDVSLTTASTIVHISPEYLSRLIKKETDNTYLELLTRIRLNKALTLLADKDVKITSIAGEVGFGNYNYFSQVFKKNYGITPSEFRKGSMPEHEGKAQG